ncbi:ubiquitin-conjugating enzyme E2 6 [Kluyveromyces marxianus]|uniref:Ubiquitin-conjugating enzyme E2 6 n=2 Tax=Kluyveromyces marxianus TaxID=4911 RepID=W0THX5_KLUMD|nr:ubiquitin-conjugating enzyme E2 6 [Kluyveromyces marxianus DMKU3-1042]QGN17935.1 ubiquitin-conjugating enzyme E2 6 [Kluyveromyces marxianus]BAO42673.1 ubiquitin-conjugating enzyme E2 6 [Kluyveromyces marxianus DMKU3-1042]
MASIQANKRLTKEYKNIVNNPPPYIVAAPHEDNILEWHYVITGPPETPYENGQYHGTLTFPSDYPFNPPAIRMITPNGRFTENTRLCLSMSDYHPEAWNPAWSVVTILNGLLSFMTGDEQTTGSISTSDREKRILAKKSKYFNTYKNVKFKNMFPDMVESNIEDLEKEAAMEAQSKMLQQKEESDAQKFAAEKATSLDDISDPEDRVRIQELLKLETEKKRENKDVRENSSIKSLLCLALAIAIFFVGLIMK